MPFSPLRSAHPRAPTRTLCIADLTMSAGPAVDLAGFVDVLNVVARDGRAPLMSVGRRRRTPLAASTDKGRDMSPERPRMACDFGRTDPFPDTGRVFARSTCGGSWRIHAITSGPSTTKTAADLHRSWWPEPGSNGRPSAFQMEHTARQRHLGRSPRPIVDGLDGSDQLVRALGPIGLTTDRVRPLRGKRPRCADKLHAHDRASESRGPMGRALLRISSRQRTERREYR